MKFAPPPTLQSSYSPTSRYKTLYVTLGTSLSSRLTTEVSYLYPAVSFWGARIRLRHCATSRKVAGSITDGVIGIFFHWYNPSDRTMVLGSTQPLTEMSTRNISLGGRGLIRPMCKADNLTTFMCRLSWSLGASSSRNAHGLPKPVERFLHH